MALQRGAELPFHGVDPTEDGRDCLLGLGEPGELESDPDVAFEGEGGVLDLPLEPDVDRVADRRDVNDDPAIDQLPGLRMMERDPETEHGDVDDLAIAPHRRGFPSNVAEAGPGGRLALCSSAVLHVDPSPFLAPPLTGGRVVFCFRSQLGV